MGLRKGLAFAVLFVCTINLQPMDTAKHTVQVKQPAEQSWYDFIFCKRTLYELMLLTGAISCEWYREQEKSKFGKECYQLGLQEQSKLGKEYYQLGLQDGTMVTYNMSFKARHDGKLGFITFQKFCHLIKLQPPERPGELFETVDAAHLLETKLGIS